MNNPVRDLIKIYDSHPGELVNKLDVSKSSIYTWVDGTHKPSRGNVNLLLDFFDIEGDERHAWKMKFKKWRGGIKND